MHFKDYRIHNLNVNGQKEVVSDSLFIKVRGPFNGAEKVHKAHPSFTTTCFTIIAILAMYCFDAMFDTESALPDLSQNFETFILQTCTNTQAKSKLSKGIFTLFWQP